MNKKLRRTLEELEKMGKPNLGVGPQMGYAEDELEAEITNLAVAVNELCIADEKKMLSENVLFWIDVARRL